MSYESQVDWLQQGEGNTDNWRLRSGLRVARLMRDKQYGAGVVAALAVDVGKVSKQTLYERAQVARFVVNWLGLRAHRVFDLYPYLSYSHLRRAMRLPYEDAIEALLAAGDGDPAYPEFVPPMSPDAFGLYISIMTGKVTDLPLEDITGDGWSVLRKLTEIVHGNRGRNIRIKVYEIE